jgi:hypothetical protein
MLTSREMRALRLRIFGPSGGSADIAAMFAA